MTAKTGSARHIDGATLDRLREGLPDYLRAVHGVENPAKAFRCIRADHEDATPSMHIHRDADGVMRVRCFGCGASGDIFDVIEWDEGEAGFTAQVERAAAVLGVPCSLTMDEATRRPSKPPRARREAHSLPPAPEIGEDRPIIWRAALDAFHALHEDPRARDALTTLHGRGFELVDIVEAGFGWCGHPREVVPGCKAPGIPGGYIVVPFRGFPDGLYEQCRYAVFRPVGGGCAAKEIKPSGYPSPIWGEHLLSRPGAPVWVVEGIYDAVAVQALNGARACALCGTSNVGRLLSIVGRTPPNRRPPLVLALDADEAGRRASEGLAKGLARIGASFARARPYPEGCKDANDVLRMTRKGGGK